MSPHSYVILGALLLAAFALGGSVADFAARARARQQCRALLRWRVRLGQLHEAHMTARDAWTRQSNARYTHRHADTVAPNCNALGVERYCNPFLMKDTFYV